MSDTNRKLDVTVRERAGGVYMVYVAARQRPDGRWEGMLEFRPRNGGDPVTSNAQTTQTTADDVFRWAAALSTAHIENSLTTAMTPASPSRPGYSSLSTPPAAYDRVQQLRQIERDILSIFVTRKTTRLRTREVFDHGPHANADFVRAFEDLEKRWRYLVRHTQDGTDWLDLTADGAREAGLSIAGTTKLPGDLPKPIG
jgi:hypothetical protein